MPVEIVLQTLPGNLNTMLLFEVANHLNNIQAKIIPNLIKIPCNLVRKLKSLPSHIPFFLELIHREQDIFKTL